MTGHRHRLVEALFPGAHLCDRITRLEETLMSQIDDLRSAIAQVGTDINEAATRIEERLADADVDLSGDIAQLRSFGEQLDSIAAETVDPGDPGTEPGGGEPPPGEEYPDQEVPFDQDNPAGP